MDSKEQESLAEHVMKAKERLQETVDSEQEAMMAATALAAAWTDRFAALMGTGRCQLTEEENEMFLTFSVNTFALKDLVSEKFGG